MPTAFAEFLLTETPIEVEIEFENGSMIKDILPVIGKRYFSLITNDEGHAEAIEKEFFSSIIITRNADICRQRTELKHGDRIKIFHLLEGG